MTPPDTRTGPAQDGPAARGRVPTLVPLTASERLALSRAQMAGWLEQDRADRAAAPLGAWQALAALPWFNRLRTHPLASLALGAAARAWLRPSPGGAAPALQVLVLGAVVSVLRRHPKTVLFTAVLGVATVFWARRRQRATSSQPNP